MLLESSQQVAQAQAVSQARARLQSSAQNRLGYL